jgi:hypothetical protein
VSSSIASPLTVRARLAFVLDTTFTLRYDGLEVVKPYRLRLEKLLDFGSIVHRQLGNRLLMVVNNPQRNGGYRFREAWWQIYSNGKLTDEQNGGRLYYASRDGKPIAGVVTLSLLDSATGSWLRVCPDTLTVPVAPNAASASVYPNPVAAGGVVHHRAAGGRTAALSAEHPAARYDAYRLLDVQGRLQRSGSTDELQNGLTMPSIPGSYFLVLEGKTGKITLLVISY